MDYYPTEKEKRSPFWSYLIVGIVGAMIGSILVVAVMPHVLFNRMETLYPLSFPRKTGEPLLSSIPEGEYTLVIEGDPWEIVCAAAEKVSPSVVGIVNKSAVGYDLFGRQFLQDKSGSGVIISSDGYIVTNYHVVANATAITVSLYDGRGLEAVIIGTDPATDLAVIKVNATGLPACVFGDSDNLRPGQLAIAIGNPLGMDFQSSITQGVVSGLDRVLQVGDGYVRLIQTDAVINPGNSGGPLINANGEVIGLNSLKMNASAVEGMGFAIPSNFVKRIAQQIIENGEVRRALVGVKVIDKKTADAYLMDITISKGLYVHEVVKDGPAEEAGIRRGDFILEFDGAEVNDFGTFWVMLSEKSPGDEVSLTILRERETMNINVILGEAG